MFCVKCGNQIPDNSTFCPRCGASVKPKNADTGVVSNSTNVQPEEPSFEKSNELFNQPQSPDEPFGVQSEASPAAPQVNEQFGSQFYVQSNEQFSNENQQNKKTKKSKLPLVLFIILDVVVVAAIIFACAYLFGSSDDGGETSDSEDYISSDAGESTSDNENDASSDQTTPSDSEGTSDDAMNVTEEDTTDSQAEETTADTYDAKAAEAEAIAEALSIAADYAETGDYLSAIQTITAAQSKHGTTDELDAAYESYSQSYVEAVISDAEELFESEDYDGALQSVNTALGIVTGNAGLTEYKSELSERIDALKPVSITELTPMKANFSWNTGTPIDPFGNDYSSSTNWSVVSQYDSNYVYEEYRIYGEYDTLTFKLAPQSNMGESNWMYVHIYIDDVLAYTSPKIVRKMDQFEAEIDLNGAEYIKILVKGGGGGNSSNQTIIISDVFLYKSDGSSASSETEDSKLVSLTKLDKINGGFSWNSACDYPQNVQGSDYTYCSNFTVQNAYQGGYAEYRLYGEYDYLSFDFAPYTSIGEDNYAYIYVYADGVLVYSSPQITRTTDLTSVTVNISGAEYIKIAVSGTKYASYIILSDVFLHEAN